MENPNIIDLSDNARYREKAEYTTTVVAAQKAVGIVTPTDCLAYELEQYEAAYKEQIYSRENIDEEGPELLSAEHPDYPQRLAERKAEGDRQLKKIYALLGQELADQWATEHHKARDKRLSLACLLKESAHRLLDGYANYLLQVGLNRVSDASVSFHARIGRGIIPVETFASRSNRMKERHEKSPGYGLSYSAGPYADLDRSLIAAGAGAAELAHFKQLLAKFYEAEQAPAVTTRPLDTANNEPAAPASSPNSPLLTPATIRTLYLKLLAHPALANELTAYQKSELRAYAESEALGATREAVGLMDANPQYPYPLAYRNGREVEHWQERIASYPDSQYVLRLLTDAVPTNPPAPSAPRHEQAAPTPDTGARVPAIVDLFAPLLLKYTLPELTGLLIELGLLGPNKHAAPAASPGAWVGVIHALLDPKRPRLRGSKAAICRAFSNTFGAVVSERAIQNGLGTRGSEAEQLMNRALNELNG